MAKGSSKRQPPAWRVLLNEDRQREQEKVKKKEFNANTRAFWQSQSSGPASPVTRIDPSTYKLKD